MRLRRWWLNLRGVGKSSSGSGGGSRSVIRRRLIVESARGRAGRRGENGRSAYERGSRGRRGYHILFAGSASAERGHVGQSTRTNGNTKRFLVVKPGAGGVKERKTKVKAWDEGEEKDAGDVGVGDSGDGGGDGGGGHTGALYLIDSTRTAHFAPAQSRRSHTGRLI